MLSACSASSDDTAEGKSLVYRVNNDETRTESYYEDLGIAGLGEDSADKCISTLIDALSEKSPAALYKAPLSMGPVCLGYTYDDGVITLDMSSDYTDLNFTTEVLVRAAVVRTLCNLDFVQSVYFTVSGEPLIDHSGFQVGAMTADTFISNDGNEINTYEEVSVTLYFVSADGNSLVGVNRKKFYPTSVPLERLVVEELIKGPSGQIDNIYPSVNPNVSILSITTKDEVCYVNLSSDILLPYGNVPTQVTATAIVNSLCRLPSVKKVQILSDGVVPEFLESSYEQDDSHVITLEEAALIDTGEK